MWNFVCFTFTLVILNSFANGCDLHTNPGRNCSNIEIPQQSNATAHTVSGTFRVIQTETNITLDCVAPEGYDRVIMYGEFQRFIDKVPEKIHRKYYKGFPYTFICSQLGFYGEYDEDEPNEPFNGMKKVWCHAYKKSDQFEKIIGELKELHGV